MKDFPILYMAGNIALTRIKCHQNEEIATFRMTMSDYTVPTKSSCRHDGWRQSPHIDYRLGFFTGVLSSMGMHSHGSLDLNTKVFQWLVCELRIDF